MMHSNGATAIDMGTLTRRLELDSLRLFSVVCREGSYAKAARVEPLTASAISKRVAELERTMGCLLLERSNYGVRPTAAGDLVLLKWKEMAASLSALISASSVASLAEPSQLSIVAERDAARFLMFDCLGHVDALDDAAKVAVVESPLNWLPIDFEKLTAHGAVWCLDGDLPGERAAVFDRFRHLPLFTFSAEVCVAVMREDHPLATLGLISASDVLPYELVCSAGVSELASARVLEPFGPSATAEAARPVSRPSWSRQVGSTLEYLATVPCAVVALLPTSARYLIHRFPGLRCVTLAEEHGCMSFGCAMREDAKFGDRVKLLERLTGCRMAAMGGGFAAAADAEAQDLGLAASPWAKPGAERSMALLATLAR